MGKRSAFDRVPRDFYPTPHAAVLPLLPHLGAATVAWEPCAGDGALVRHLEDSGIETYGALDIEPRGRFIARGDALQARVPADCTHIITNPPWNRRVLHPMITHFSAMRPTWLLFDADWVHTRQAVPFMPWLRRIVSVGRVKWIAGSAMTGKDNCAWHLFDQSGRGPTEFHGRQEAS